ncbi:MAG: hypothetical protein JXR47_03065 [Thiotrichales bacterium]|nr:hypothetical protein [Thiotrichales bacterium]
MSSQNAALYEVYYQDSPDSPVDKDIVFSIEEAQESVLGFYNDCIQKYLLDEVEPLESYDEVALLQNQYARQLKGKAWFVAVQEDKMLEIESDGMDDIYDEALDFSEKLPSVDELDTLFDTVSDQFFSRLTTNLKRNLENRRVFLKDSEIHQIVSDALWHDVTDAFLISRQDKDIQADEGAVPEVFLVMVRNNDAAVYFGTEYIDAADQSNDDDLQVIVDTAQMLAEKYETTIHTHQFEAMEDGWNWTKIENILKAAGIMPAEKPNLLRVLQDIESLRLSVNAHATVNGFEYHLDAFNAYVFCGDDTKEVLTIDINHQFQQDQIHLTVEDVVKAIEIEPNRWVCGDLLSTEVIVNPRKYFNTSIQNLVR